MSRLTHEARTHLGVKECSIIDAACLSTKAVDDGGTPARVRWTGPGASLLLLACREGTPFGGLLSGAGRTPSRSDNACPARAFPVLRQQGINPALPGGQSPTSTKSKVERFHLFLSHKSNRMVWRPSPSDVPDPLGGDNAFRDQVSIHNST